MNKLCNDDLPENPLLECADFGNRIGELKLTKEELKRAILTGVIRVSEERLKEIFQTDTD